MADNLHISLIVIIACTISVGCHDSNNTLKGGPSSGTAGGDPRGLARKADPDNISGKWFWATAVVPTAPTKQIATIKRSGDSVVGEVVWLLDDGYSANITNGKTDGTKVSFDATFIKRNVNLGDVEMKFSYSGTLKDERGMWIWGTCTITGVENGKPVTLEHPWNAFPEP